MADDPLQALVNLRAALEKALEPLGLTLRMFAPVIESDGPHSLQIVCTIDPDVLGKSAEQIEQEKAQAASLAEMEESLRQQDHEQKRTENIESAQRLLGKLRKKPDEPGQ